MGKLLVCSNFRLTSTNANMALIDPQTWWLLWLWVLEGIFLSQKIQNFSVNETCNSSYEQLTNIWNIYIYFFYSTSSSVFSLLLPLSPFYLSFPHTLYLCPFSSPVCLLLPLCPHYFYPISFTLIHFHFLPFTSFSILSSLPHLFLTSLLSLLSNSSPLFQLLVPIF